ncbi:MAG: phosphoglycerate mutase family protein [Myxococcota bacterium]
MWARWLAATLAAVSALSSVGVGCRTMSAGTTAMSAGTTAMSAGTTVYLVRHAEKAQGDDPGLTEEGAARAQGLVVVLGAAGLSAVFATQYRRTQQTVAPVAEAAGLAVQTVRASETRQLADRIRARHRGQTVLAAAHSNTLPELIAALGVRERVVIESDDYGDLFVVTLHGDGTTTLTRRRFGD